MNPLPSETQYQARLNAGLLRLGDASRFSLSQSILKRRRESQAWPWYDEPAHHLLSFEQVAL